MRRSVSSTRRTEPVLRLPSVSADVHIIAEDGVIVSPSFLGVPFDGAPHLEEEIAKRSEVDYGDEIPSPLGRKDRLFQMASDRTAEATARMYAMCADDEPDVNWSIVGTCSVRENPGQGLQSAPEPGIKEEPDSEDWALARAFWAFLAEAPPEIANKPPILSVPRISAMGFPFMSREEALRTTVVHALPEFCDPYYGGIQDAARAYRRGKSHRDARRVFTSAVASPVQGIPFACTSTAMKGMRAQPGKLVYNPVTGNFDTLKPGKETTTWRGEKEEIKQHFGKKRKRGRVRVRRVIGKPLTWNTTVSLQRRRCSGPLYHQLDVLPTEEAEQALFERCVELGRPGVQLDGDGTDTLCPAFLPSIYAYTAAEAGNKAGAAMCALTGVGNLSAAGQMSNVWHDPGVSGYGDATALSSPVYMGYQSGLDSVAPFTVISSQHSFGRCLQCPDIRKEYAGASWNVNHLRLPTSAEFWHWIQACLRRRMPEPGLPSIVWRGDGARFHAKTQEEEDFWEWTLTAGPHNREAHLRFAKDHAVETDGKVFRRGDLRAYAPKRIAYFQAADDLRTQRTYLGLGLVALAQSLRGWGRKAVIEAFRMYVSEATRGDIPDFERFAGDYAKLDAETLALFDNYEDNLVILKPDRIDWMPEEFLQHVSQVLLSERRVYLTEEEAAPLFEAADDWADIIVNNMSELFELANV